MTSVLIIWPFLEYWFPEAGAALSPTVLKYRLLLIDTMAKTLRSAMNLLGIELPERM